MKKILLAMVTFTTLILTGCSGRPSASEKDASEDSEPISSGGSPRAIKSEEPERASSCADEETIEQKNAVASAKSCLELAAFSRDGLVADLELVGYSTEDAEYAADHCGADWKQQAILNAKMYFRLTAHSRKSLLSQLEFDKFSTEDAEYALDNCGADWNEQAKLSVEEYLNILKLSHDELIVQLKFEGYTKEQMEYGLSQNGIQ